MEFRADMATTSLKVPGGMHAVLYLRFLRELATQPYSLLALGRVARA